MRLSHLLVLVLAAALVFTATAALVGSRIQARPAPVDAKHEPVCKLKSPVQHVVYVVFDNVHFTRDQPNVPSDLEQMPHLLSFIKSNGALLAGLHTPLIAHTGGDIVTGLTGLYPDRQGQAVSNSYRYFDRNGVPQPAESFTYWTSRVYDRGNPSPTDTSYNLVSEAGRNAPAPWTAFTRAGCNVGAAGVANLELENGGNDAAAVFGPGSAEAREAGANPSRAVADFEGLAVHCAAGSAFCADQATSRPDRLPDEPGGYEGFRAVFGQRYLASRLGPLRDLGGAALDSFPGFGSLTPAVTLAYLAAMQEHGVPVTLGYVSDAHDRRAGGSYGPGEAGYAAQLRDYDAAFGAFFDRLGQDGLDARNTLFVFTADEGDHFAGGKPSPASCDGLSTACSYAQLGEVALNLTGLLASEGFRTPFAVHADSAPAVYINGNPAETASVTRALERGAAAVHVTNPYTGIRELPAAYLAGRAELKLLHMVTADPARTPTFVYFMKPDYFGSTGSASCSSDCVRVDAGSAWNHGSISEDMNTTWLGLVGPGVVRGGADTSTWSDEADIRPTLLFLTGLRDPYRSDGRVLAEAIEPAEMGPDRAAFLDLARAYKMIDAPLGELGMRSLAASTAAMAGSDAGYQRFVEVASTVQARRDSLAAQMSVQLEAAAFDKQALDAATVRSLVEQAAALVGTNMT